MTLIRKIENEFTYETDAKTMLNIFMGGEMERKVDQYQLEYDESGMPLDNVGAIIYIKFRCGFAGNYYISPGNLYSINIFMEPEIEHCFKYIGNIYINQTGRECKAVLSFDYGESPDIDLQWFFLPGREIVRKIWRDKIEEFTSQQGKESPEKAQVASAPPVIRDPLEEEIKRLSDEGLLIWQIAQRVGYSQSTVKRRRKKMGYKKLR